MAKPLSDIGLVGLAVMGQNLALNIADHGFQISVFNRTTEKTDKFVAENPNTPGGVVGTKTVAEFVGHQDRQQSKRKRQSGEEKLWAAQSDCEDVEVAFQIEERQIMAEVVLHVRTDQRGREHGEHQ